ncbi:MAG: hypothetical protein WBC51_20285 [Vicinamibacterales bacterium]
MITRTPPIVTVDDLPWIIAAEFDEQPGLRLTLPQVRNMWGLSPQECENVLEYLVSTGDLRREGNRYCRPH